MFCNELKYKKINFLKFFLLSLFTIAITYIIIIFINFFDFFYNYRATNISLFFLVVSIIIIAFDNKNLLYKNLNLKNIIYCSILTLIFILLLSVENIYNELNLGKNFQIINIIYILIFTISIFICLLKVFIYSTVFDNKKDKNTTNKKLKFYLMIIFTVITFIYAFSTLTGYYQDDIYWDIKMTHNDLSNFRTYAYALLLIITKNIFKTTFPIILLQSIFWLYNMNYSLQIIDNATKSKRNLIIFAFLQIILLVGFKEISFLEKDTIFAMGLYLFVLNLINFIYTKKITKKILFLSIFSGIIISCFRHAGILVAIITFILLIIICLKNNHKKYIKTIIYIIGVILIFVSIFTFVCTKIFHGKNDTKILSYTVPIYQVATFINNDYSFSNIDIEYLEQLYPIDFWKSNYKKNNGDQLARNYLVPEIFHKNIKNFNYNKLIDLNFKLFLNHPNAYIKSLMEYNNSLWRITDDEEWCNWFYYIKTPLEFNINNKNYILNFKETPFSNIKNIIEKILIDNSLLYNIKSRGGFAIYIFILCVALCIYKKQYKLIVPIIPIVIWWCLLFISLPINLTRYIIIFIISFPIILILCMNQKVI